MKAILFAAFIACTLLTFSCKKSTESPASALFIGADLQGASWLAQPSTEVLSNDTLVIQGLRETDNQDIKFKFKFSGVGNYKLTATNQASYSTTDAANINTATYRLDTTQTNTVTITSYNVGPRILTGNFQLNFIKTSGAATFGNTANFTNGQFWIALPPF
jgi:hypothetical protein